MPSIRTQTGLSLKSNSEKSHKLLSSLKEAVRSTFSKGSEETEWEEGRERPKYQLREHPDIKTTQDEEDWAYVYQEVLADCVPDESPNSYRADKGISVDDLRAIADEDQLFAGSRPTTRDGCEAPPLRDQRRPERPPRYPGDELFTEDELDVAAEEYQRRIESLCYPTGEREAAPLRDQRRPERPRRYAGDKLQGTTPEDQLRPETRRFVN